MAGPGDCLSLVPMIVLSALVQLWIDGCCCLWQLPVASLAMGPTARGIVGSCGSLWDACIVHSRVGCG